MFKQYYESPVGRLVMGSDGVALTDLCFVSSSHAEKVGMYEESPLPVFNQTKKWLDIYFSGKAPEFTPPIKLQDLSPFRKQVVNIISRIPYGKTMTYGEIAPKVANIRLAVGSMMYPSYHDRIMVEIDRYELFGLEKGKMNFAEFKQAVENIGNSPLQINYNTPNTVSVYTVGAYDFAILEPTNVRILNDDNYTGIGYKEQVEKIIDEENQKYGYKHTFRFSKNNTITIQDEVVEEYIVNFVHDWDSVSMNKDLFTLSVNGEIRAKTSGYDYIQGVIKFSDFTVTELPKLKIDFLKYADENYKNFYDALTFDLAGTQAQRSADGSYVEIEFDKYYNYNFGHDRYVISTNALELLKTMDRVTGKSSRIVDKIEMNGTENSSQHGSIETSELIQNKCVGRSIEGIVYFLKNEYLLHN